MNMKQLVITVQVHFCLEAMGKMVLDVGDEPRLGSVMKLTGNFFIVSFIEIIAEGGGWPADRIA